MQNESMTKRDCCSNLGLLLKVFLWISMIVTHIMMFGWIALIFHLVVIAALIIDEI